MKLIRLFICGVALLGIPSRLAVAQSASDSAAKNKPDISKPAAEAVHAHPQEIPLWPAVAPGSEGQDSAEIVQWRGEKEASFPIVTNIHHPSITPYIPEKEKAMGAAIIIAPGGGHQFLSIDHEGYDVAKYFSDHGVAAFVLKYRLAKAKDSPYKVNEQPVMDARRAMRTLRSRAEEWNIDPKRIGMMGFSAGGEVVTQLILQPDGSNSASDDAVTAVDSKSVDDPLNKISSRPDFQALIYPGQSKNIQVDAKTPPAFLCCSYDDRPDISEGLTNVYLQFKKANVPAELHIYSTGGHGFGIRPRPIAESTWPDRFLDWMKDRGFVKKQ